MTSHLFGDVPTPPLVGWVQGVCWHPNPSYHTQSGHMDRPKRLMVQMHGQMALWTHQGLAREEDQVQCWDACRAGE